MPIYEYQSEQPDNPELSCHVCRRPFELRRPMSRSADLSCPICKNPLKKLISRVSTTKNDSFSSKKAKDAGFTVLNNVGDGVVEKE